MGKRMVFMGAGAVGGTSLTEVVQGVELGEMEAHPRQC